MPKTALPLPPLNGEPLTRWRVQPDKRHPWTVECEYRYPAEGNFTKLFDCPYRPYAQLAAAAPEMFSLLKFLQHDLEKPVEQRASSRKLLQDINRVLRQIEKPAPKLKREATT